MSTLKYEIADSLKADAAFCSFVAQLPLRFAEGGETVYNKRNVIKIFEIGGQQVVVKRFKKPGFLQRVVYSFFRPGKAKRAFCNALELQNRKVDTPKPLAYAEEKQGGLLSYCFYVSATDFSAPIADRLNCDDGSFDLQLAGDFARFAVYLHKNGILHHDLNSTNVLYKQQTDTSFSFSVIDINRMDFFAPNTSISAADRYENLTRFTGNLELFRFVAEAYAREVGGDVPQIVNDLVETKRRHDLAWRRRKNFTRKLKKLFAFS